MKNQRQKLDQRTFYEKGIDYFLSHLSIDCVIFGFHDNQLKVLLLEWKDNKDLCLPGGFIYKDEHIDDAASRILIFRTGLDQIHLQQFYTFGDPQREQGKEQSIRLRNVPSTSWFHERFVSIGYWALVEFSKVVPTADELSSACRWWNIDAIPTLIADHNKIILKALDSLRKNITEYPVGKELLPPKFTMPELQNLYETILGKKLDRRNFQKKMLSLNILERLSERRQGGAHKAPYLYRFNAKKYSKAMKEGINLIR